MRCVRDNLKKAADHWGELRKFIIQKTESMVVVIKGKVVKAGSVSLTLSIPGEQELSG